MITRKIVGTAILIVCAFVPITIFFISALIEAIKDVIKYGDFSSLLAVFWFTAVMVGFGLVIF